MTRFSWTTVVASLLTAAAACGGRGGVQSGVQPAALFDSAMAAFRRGDCGKAQRDFQRLTFEVSPRDEQHATARYYLAECLLTAGERLEAAIQFRRVADEFPQHRLAPDALLRAGDAYGGLWKTPELDPTYGETARATYQELLQRYPEHAAAARAGLRIRDLDEQFAAKTYKQGMFYLRLRAFDSAIIYFKDVVARFPRTPHAPQAVSRLIAAYDRIGYVEERREMCTHLRTYYPEEPPPDACAEAATSP